MTAKSVRPLSKGLLATLALSAVLALPTPLPAQEIAEDDLQYMSFSQLDAKTKAVVDRVLQAVGGDAQLSKLQSLRKASVVTQKTQDGVVTVDFDGVAVFPGSLYATIKTPQRKLTAVATAESAHVFKSDAPIEGAAMKMNDNEKRTFLQFFYEQPVLVLRNRNQTGFLVASGGTATIAGKPVDVLAVLVDDYMFRWYVDSSGRVIRTAFGTSITELEDWRQVSGLTIPFREHRFRDGKEVADTRVTSFVANPPVDVATLFAKPRFWMARNALPGRSMEGAYWNGHSYENGYDYYDDYVYFVVLFW